jgi:hypothetical protein
MRIPPGLIQELNEKTGLSTRTTYTKIKETRKQHGGFIALAQAAAIYAEHVGIRVQKYFPPDFLEKLVPLTIPKPVSAALLPQKGFRTNGQRPIIIKFGNKPIESIPFLTPQIAKDAEEMAYDVYPHIYLFENSLRQLILEVMSSHFGTDWWCETNVNREVIRKVSDRKKAEGTKRWHGKRGDHDIFYTDLDDLKTILNRHYNLFNAYFDDQNQMNTILNEVESLRNIIAHSNRLDPDDIERLRTTFKIWVKKLSPVPETIPAKKREDPATL